MERAAVAWQGAVSTVAAFLKGIVNGSCCERETLRSPLSGVHELRGGFREPLRYAHGQGPFGPAPPLEEPVGEVGALPQLRDLNIDRAGTGVEIAVPVTVTPVSAIIGDGAVSGAADGVRVNR